MEILLIIFLCFVYYIIGMLCAYNIISNCDHERMDSSAYIIGWGLIPLFWPFVLIYKYLHNIKLKF